MHTIMSLNKWVEEQGPGGNQSSVRVTRNRNLRKAMIVSEGKRSIKKFVILTNIMAKARNIKKKTTTFYWILEHRAVISE